MNIQTLHYGEQLIRYRVHFDNKSRNKLSIHVLPRGEVRVDAPAGAELSAIKRAVTKRAAWLSKHLSEIAQCTGWVLPREYVSGESHYYLGRRYLLKVRPSREEESSVSLRHGRFEIVAPTVDRSTVKSMLWEWYRERARVVFAASLDQWIDHLPWLEQPPPWKLVAMKGQWGSCSPRGLLSINTHLVKAPRHCIHYVLLHELCHLRVHNHSRRFHRLLSMHMSDWKATKHHLDRMADALLAF